MKDPSITSFDKSNAAQLHSSSVMGCPEPISHIRNREYYPALQRWMQQDPIGYINGSNLYETIEGNPVSGLEPMGLKRVVFAFEGLGGFNDADKRIVLNNNTAPIGNNVGIGRNASYPFLLRLIKDAHLTTANDTEVDYYAQNGVGPAVQDAIKLNQDCNNIIVLGFSQGGDAAIQFAGDLRSKGINIALGFTVDPVPKGAGLATRHFVDFTKPENATKWVNYYENVPGTLRIVGHSVQGAETDLDITTQVKAYMISQNIDPQNLLNASINSGRLIGGHLFITRVQDPVIDSLTNEVNAVPADNFGRVIVPAQSP